MRRVRATLLAVGLAACGTDGEEVVVDAFGQVCPPGGLVDVHAWVHHPTCSEEVHEARCAAWWGASPHGDDMETWVEEVDRCLVRPQWFGDADYRSDPRVVAYGGGDGCTAERLPDCDG